MDNACGFVVQVGQAAVIVAGILCFISGGMVHRWWVGSKINTEEEQAASRTLEQVEKELPALEERVEKLKHRYGL